VLARMTRGGRWWPIRAGWVDLGRPRRKLFGSRVWEGLSRWARSRFFSLMAVRWERARGVCDLMAISCGRTDLG